MTATLVEAPTEGTAPVETPPMPKVYVPGPGVYDISNEAYQADPIDGGSLSSTGARRLISPSCPAKFKWERDNGRPPKKVFDFGHAAHHAVLGVGEEIEVCDFRDWKTKKAQDQRDAAYAAGKTPILTSDNEIVQAMAAAILADPIASALFDPARGKGEQTLVWRDEESGVMCRARYDWLPDLHGGRLIIPDYKTAATVEPGGMARAFASHGYYMQAAWYLDGAKACGLAGGQDPAFVFVAQEKTPPYLITLAEFDHEAMALGRLRNREALTTYARCVKSGTWPGYADDVIPLSLPPYMTRDLAMENF